MRFANRTSLLTVGFTLFLLSGCASGLQNILKSPTVELASVQLVGARLQQPDVSPVVRRCQPQWNFAADKSG